MPVTTYRLFGLCLESELDFPELPLLDTGSNIETAAGSDVRLSCAQAGWSAWGEALQTLRGPSDGRPVDWFGAEANVAWFDWPDVARVRIAEGHAIDVDPCDGVDEAGLRSAVLGPVFSVLLAQRGLYPLHASSVVMNETAVAFAGPSGTGKSTLALTLQEREHDFLSDDVTAIEVATDPVRAVPAFPQVKMLPDLIAHRGDDGHAMPLVNPIEDKRARRFTGTFRRDALPLGRVYLVDDGEAEIRGPVPVKEAFFEALKHGHRSSLLQRTVGQEELMRRCSRIADTVPFYRLRRPRGLNLLDELARRVEEHVGR